MSSRTEEIFSAVRHMASAEERAAYLDAACDNDALLRARVEALLQAEADAITVHTSRERAVTELNASRPPADTPVTKLHIPASEQPGSRIGPYRLLQLLGEGGFGSVFMAQQEQPVIRKVALKIIKLGMDTRQVVARFEQERQALAMMDHPNIARVLDGGATDTG